MNKSLTIAIIKQGHEIIKEEAVGIQIPAHDGYLGILPNRQPLMTIMGLGIISLTNDKNEKKYYATSGGFAEVDNNVVTLLCDSIVTSADLLEESSEEQETVHSKTIDKMSESEKNNYLKKLLKSKINS